jgi:glycosyltransferase involved in cell wall biosynthesis
MSSNKLIKYTVVVPVFNEGGAIYSLCLEIVKVMESLKNGYEILIVDDGSTDNTVAEASKVKEVKIIKLRKNFGQSTALDIGFKASKGEIVITLDGDGQNDPNDIPGMLGLLSDKVDFVCGWRKNRKDSFEKKFVSKGASYFRKLLIDDGVNDSGCTLRVYKSDCLEGLDLDGEMHRMIPAILKLRGFKTSELVVNHRPRNFGKTKYGSSRIMRAFLDMLLIWFDRKFNGRPIHLFGSVGITLIVFSSVLLLVLAILRLNFGYQLSDKIWPLVGINAFSAGLQLLIFGLLADLIRKNSTKPRDWVVKE